ncbi:MAG: polysaccharide pyruvyl transferase family protein [Clostridia bacterium]|nr:polysaccharide pyruvyl transferase family protein [Clostridia bacterium]
MKIGILTFHWGANHGAILQTYALSRYLQQQGAEVEVIDYYPKNLELTFYNALRAIRPGAVLRKCKELRKEKCLKDFRTRLPRSKRYYTNAELQKADLPYDVLITGSDQIWNPSFLRYGEGKVTPVYFLNFGGDNVKKLSVSASFGCHSYPEECKALAAPLLREFDGISVRENTGLDILASMGIENACVTADPTALLPGDAYRELCSAESDANGVSTFILRKQTAETNALLHKICRAFTIDKPVDIDLRSIPDWLAAIRDSRLVVTNSFHCVMMCLKLHTPFAVLLETGTMAGMNDRFVTLLAAMGLSDRIVYREEDIPNVAKEIDFSAVDAAMDRYAGTLREYLERNLDAE